VLEDDTNLKVDVEDILLPLREFLGRELKGRCQSYIYNRYLDGKFPKGVGLTNIIGQGMEVPTKIGSLPALYAELGKLPKETEKNMVYLIQLPELDLSGHIEVIERFGSPKEVMYKQILNQYDRFMTSLLGLVHKMTQNAQKRKIPCVFLVVSDHGMDFCVHPSTGHHDIFTQIGVRFEPYIRRKGDDAQPIPHGAYPMHLNRDLQSKSNRIGVFVPATASGKHVSYYLLSDPNKTFRYTVLCSCGKSYTLSDEDPEGDTCPFCNESYQVTHRGSFNELLVELERSDWKDVWVKDSQSLGVKESSPGRLQPVMFVFSKPGVFLKATRRLEDQEIYENLAPLLDSGEWVKIEELSRRSAVSPQKFDNFLEEFMKTGYLEGSKRTPFGSDRLTHVRKRETPLIGVLSHGSCSTGESVVPFLCQVVQ
jgi:hypothetical protein